MGDFFASLPPWLGTLPQLLTSGGTLAILAILSRVYLGKGQLNIQAEQVADAAEAKLREHFTGELTRLSGEINEAKDRQLACEGREEKLRRRVSHLEDEVTGLQRIIALNSSTLLLDSTGDGRTSEAVRDAAIRVLQKLAEHSEDNG